MGAFMGGGGVHYRMDITSLFLGYMMHNLDALDHNAYTEWIQSLACSRIAT